MRDNPTRQDLLIQADLDGELTPGEATRAAELADASRDHGDVYDSLQALSLRLKAGSLEHKAPSHLRHTVLKSLRTKRDRDLRPSARTVWTSWAINTMSVGSGVAAAAALALFVMMPSTDKVSDSVVAAHVRALQPGHLLDVASTDQHTVKPWFDGRLPFVPPVKDLATKGFPLVGGRLDYLPGQLVAALVYNHQKHIIELYVWPTNSQLDRQPSSGRQDGYNYVRWREDGMSFWAVTDASQVDLDRFARDWRAQ